MSKATYIGVADKARKVKKMYIGVADKARHVKKGYIGVGGVARPFYSLGPAYYGSVSNLTAQMYMHFGGTIGNYMVFGGGRTTDSYANNKINAYTKTFVRSNGPTLDVSQYYYDSIPAVSNSKYLVLFGVLNYSTPTPLWYAINASLVLSSTTSPTLGGMQPYGYAGLGGARAGDNAVFAGGLQGVNANSIVASANASFVISRPSDLQTGRGDMASFTINNSAIFAGGSGSSYSLLSTAEAFNASLVRSTLSTGLSSARTELIGVSNGVYGFAAGGRDSTGNYVTTVDAFNASFVRSAAPALSQARDDMASAQLGDYAFLTGGIAGYDYVKTVDVYDKSLIRSVPDKQLQTGRALAAAASLDNVMIVAGGISGSNRLNTCEAYMI